jgi:hypothetical protein
VDAGALARRAVADAIETLTASGSPMSPFSLRLDTSARRPQDARLDFTRCQAEYLEDGLEQARAGVAAAPPGVTMYAVAWDGYATVGGQRSDAILVEAGTADSPQAVVLARRYLIEGPGQVALVGEIMEAQTLTSRLWRPGADAVGQRGWRRRSRP